MEPSEFFPRTIDELIGPAHRTARVLLAKLKRAAGDPEARAKWLLYGPPGTGKTALADVLAAAASGEAIERIRLGHGLAVERYSGLDVTIDKVRAWEQGNAQRSLFGDWQVKLINEVDKMPAAAQDRLLEYLDKLPARHAFIGTSNMQISQLQERFSTRLQPWKIMGPTEAEIAALLARWPTVPAGVARQIAFGSGGCVRAACLDAQGVIDVQLAEAA